MLMDFLQTYFKFKSQQIYMKSWALFGRTTGELFFSHLFSKLYNSVSDLLIFIHCILSCIFFFKSLLWITFMRQLWIGFAIKSTNLDISLLQHCYPPILSLFLHKHLVYKLILCTTTDLQGEKCSKTTVSFLSMLEMWIILYILCVPKQIMKWLLYLLQ